MSRLEARLPGYRFGGVLVLLLITFVFTAIGDIGSQRFFAQQASASTADYLYFSYVTLTTVGYGDLTAAGDVARAVAVLEASLGRIYLVTVIALLVANLGRGNRPSMPSEALVDAAPEPHP